jgi:Predicted ATPase
MEAGEGIWYIEMFGGLRAARGEAGPVIERFQTRKTEALLACLALPAGQPRDREALADLLWPDAPPDAGRNRLTQAVVWLRPQLEPPGTARGSVLVADRQSVALGADAVHTDVAAFEDALKRAAGETAPEERATWLRTAVDLYRGPLLPRLDDEWVLGLRQRLLDQFLGALRALIAHEEAAGRLETALAYARRAHVADPLAEDAYLDVIRLLAASGQVSAARRQYREMERVLADTLGEEPSPAARALLDALRRGDAVAGPTSGVPTAPAIAAATVPAPAAPTAPPLPAPLTRFFGRADEIAHLHTLLAASDVRLVTLVGIGGSGKTRLALETMRAWRGGGVWFLPLADLEDARQVPDALADLMRLPRGTDAALTTLDRVADTLAREERPPVLVLDNAEHLLSGVAPLVRALLERAPRLTVLVTSRQRLGLEGESEWPVRPLSVPAAAAEPDAPFADNDSVRLFVDRARAVRPGFALTEQNAATVARLCARLEGLPLAIELCAAWAQTLTPAQMLAQLNHRFDLLVSRRADIPERHRSLRAVVENSFLLLPEDAQRFFVRLSVFRGGWTLGASAAVCLDADGTAGAEADGGGPATLTALRLITELRERSLVAADEGTGDAMGDAGAPDAQPAMRYRMLETLREFAAQQRTIAVDEETRRRHARYFLGVAEAAERAINGPSQALALATLNAEVDNLRAALAWCAEIGGDAVVPGLRMAAALVLFWDVRGYAGEGREWLERLLRALGPEDALPAGGDLPRVLARAMQALARLARSQGSFDAAQAAAGEALRRWTALGDRSGRGQALLLLASIAYTQEDYAGARRMQEEALALAREAGDSLLETSALLGLGNVAMEQEEWERAWTLFGECLELYRAADNRVLIAATLNNMGLIARYRGDYDAAKRLLEEDLEICRALGSRSHTAVSLLNLGTVQRLRGDLAAAGDALRQATELARAVDDRRALAWCLKESGHLAAARGDYPAAVRLLAASENQRRALGMTFKPADPEALETDRDRARAALGRAAFEALWTEGETLPLPAACAEALTSAKAPKS